MSEKKTGKNPKEETTQVYEIGYLLLSSIPSEKIADEADSLKEILSKKKAEMIGEEAPELRPLAYEMVKKIGTSNQRFNDAYFGWLKFELAKSEIESVKKSFEQNPSVLRILLINTVKENTYLGKKSPVPTVEVPIEVAPAPVVAQEISEENDKGVETMVKEA